MTTIDAIKGLKGIAEWNFGKYEQTGEEDYRNDGEFLMNVIGLLKAKEPCEDAVSREAVINITAETGALETQVRVKQLPSVQSIHVPRVMALEEVLATEVVYAEDIDKAEIIPVLVNRRVHNRIVLVRAHLMGGPSYVIYPLISEYGQRWRCWTSRPTDELRKATPWK